jgi:uncharacterized damage-inducible protein DinB
MAGSMAARYRRWFEYEKDSHRRVLAALETAPRNARRTAAFRKAIELAAHIAAARGVWLFRLGAAGGGPMDFFPRGLTLPQLKRRFRRMHAAWSSYMTRATDRRIARSFAYTSTEGIRYRNTVEDILTQLYGHSLYHRGQIAALLRAAGAEPPETDFVFWTRKPVASGTRGAKRTSRKRRPS